MRDLSPHSPNTSASLHSAVTSPAFSAQLPPSHHHHAHPAHRPLPLSPSSADQIPTLQSAEEAFGSNPQAAAMATSSHPPMTRKLTHPGPLTMVPENEQIALSRTLTDQSLGSVFSPKNTTPVQQQQQLQQPPTGGHQLQNRSRSNTLPSPYEVPDNNIGASVPFDMVSGGSGGSGGSLQQRGGGNFPPPPAHSPPPLTPSSIEFSGRLSDEHHHHHHPHQPHPHQQQPGPLPGGQTSSTVPRGNQRSFSTSAAPSHAISKHLTHMKSDGNIHDTNRAAAEYTDPGLDFSMHGPAPSGPIMMGGGPSMMRRGSDNAPRHYHSLDRGARPLYPSHQQHQQHFQQQQQQQQQGRFPGMINGALASSSDQFDSVGDPIPHYHQRENSPFSESGSEGDTRKKNRESLFSETSTELSVSGNSDKEAYGGHYIYGIVLSGSSWVGII